MLRIILLVLLVFTNYLWSQENVSNESIMTPPESSAEIFMEDLVSGKYSELNAIFNQEMTEFYFTRRGIKRGLAEILISKLVDGKWSEPVNVGFTTDYTAIDLFLTNDDQTMIFCSNSPHNGTGKPKIMDHDFWISERVEGKWGKPVPFAVGAMSKHEDYYPIITNSGNLYLNSQREGQGTNNIYVSKSVDGKHQPAEMLPAPINSNAREFDAYVSPAETLIIFASEREGGFGGSDLYASVKQSDGSWTTPRNLGPKINSEFYEYGAMPSPDGKIFFFTRGSRTGEDIYWISAKQVKELTGN